MQSCLLRAASGALVCITLLVGCSGDDDGQGGESAPPANTATTEAGGSAVRAAESGAGIEDIDVEDVLVEQTVSLPENPDDKVSLGLHSLTVEGDVMVLRVVLTPQFASQSNDAAVSLYATLGGRSFRPRLIDGLNLKEYSPIGGPATPWVADSVEVRAVNGSPMLAWGYFAAPEDAIETIDVRVNDVWPVFTDVPISR